MFNFALFFSHSESCCSTYIALEDVLAKLANPSVCDLKMGRVACPPDVSPEKIRSENAKYPYRDTVGFLLTGMKVGAQTKSNCSKYGIKKYPIFSSLCL